MLYVLYVFIRLCLCVTGLCVSVRYCLCVHVHVCYLVCVCVFCMQGLRTDRAGSLEWLGGSGQLSGWGGVGCGRLGNGDEG